MAASLLVLYVRIYAETRERGLACKCWQEVSRQRCLHVYCLSVCMYVRRVSRTHDRLHAKDALPVSSHGSGEKVAGLGG